MIFTSHSFKLCDPKRITDSEFVNFNRYFITGKNVSVIISTALPLVPTIFDSKFAFSPRERPDTRYTRFCSY